jgi:hypothetical protein
VIVALALLGATSAVRRREAWVMPPLVVFVYLSVLSSGLETHARFRVPFVPILAVLAVRGLAGLYGTRASGRSGIADGVADQSTTRAGMQRPGF